MSPDFQTYGTALVVSGPSGTGKTTVCKELLKQVPDLHFSVSCTTRPKRLGEEDGIDYHFLDRDQFDARIQDDAFLEYAEVHGNLYGTLRSEVETHVDSGGCVLLDIDVQGADQVRSRILHSMLGYCTEYVFVGPPSYAEMERRLRGRGTDPEEVIQRRLRNARAELAAWKDYEYLVVNDDVDKAVDKLRAILKAATLTTRRMRGKPWPEAEADNGI